MRKKLSLISEIFLKVLDEFSDENTKKVIRSTIDFSNISFKKKNEKKNFKNESNKMHKLKLKVEKDLTNGNMDFNKNKYLTLPHIIHGKNKLEKCKIRKIM